MLLIELNINGTTNYLSQEGIALNKYWDAKVISFNPPQYSMSKKYGGYVKPTFGDISFFQDLFDNNWTPPTTCQIVAKYNANNAITEEGATTLFVGTAHLKRINRDEIQYGLWSEKIGTGSTMPANTVYNDVSLKDVFVSSAATLGLALDTTFARSSSTEVRHTVSSSKEMLSFLSDISASFSHMYYIERETIYLVDLFQDTDSTIITEFDYYPSNLEIQPSIISADTQQFGLYQSGLTYSYAPETKVDVFVESVASVATCVENIWDTWNKPHFNLKMPFAEPLPSTPGMRVQWFDTSNTKDVSAYLRVRNIRYDFDNEQMTVIGEGEIESG